MDNDNANKIWLKSYAPGIPADMNPDVYNSLAELFDESCKQFADKPAFYSMGKTINYAELHELTSQFAAFFQNELGLKKGDRVAIMLPNLLQYPVVMFAALRAGLVVVNVNPLYTVSELTYQLKDSGAETIIVLSNFADTVQKAAEKLPNLKNIIVTDIGDMLPTVKAWIIYAVLKYVQKKIPDWNIPNAIMFKDALKKGKSQEFQPPEISNTDTAFLQYTGGTTGVSKGAVLTHRNLVANLEQALVWCDGMFKPGKEIIITALPLYHIFSLTINCLLFTRLGGLNVLIVNPRDLPAMVKELKRFNYTVITGVNTLFNALLKDPEFSKLDFSSLSFALGGGMAVQKAVAERWFELTGKPLLEGYGLTETSPIVTVNRPDLKAYSGSIGLPLPSTDVILLGEDGKPVQLNEPGELAVKGPQVMQGYWNNPEETAKVFTSDGWLLTGDMGTMDADGYIKLLERKKDMILVSGFNVYPNEVEGVLTMMPGIVECAVVGVPDENSGEAVKAFVVVDDDSVTAGAVTKFCRQHLTSYKVPKQVEFREELPKTNVGKILRRALRDESAKPDSTAP